MATYEICYLDSQRHLLGNISTDCVNDRQAAVFAFAMTFRNATRLEVWCADTLVCDGPVLAFSGTDKPVPIAPFQLRRPEPETYRRRGPRSQGFASFA